MRIAVQPRRAVGWEAGGSFNCVESYCRHKMKAGTVNEQKAWQSKAWQLLGEPSFLHNSFLREKKKTNTLPSTSYSNRGANLTDKSQFGL